MGYTAIPPQMAPCGCRVTLCSNKAIWLRLKIGYTMIHRYTYTGYSNHDYPDQHGHYSIFRHNKASYVDDSLQTISPVISQWRRHNANRPTRFTIELAAAATPASSKVDFRVDRRSNRSPDCFRQETWTCRPKKCKESGMQCDFTCSKTQLYTIIWCNMCLCSFVIRKQKMQREMWHAMNEMTLLFGMQQHSVIWCI